MLKPSFEADEKTDLLAMQDLIAKDPLQVAKALSERLSKRYGFEFGGFVKVNYNVNSDLYLLELGGAYREEIERGDFLQIPERVRFYRELSQAKKKKN